ncbi:hypothetical protein PC129_g5831 [Phytophthora cactorum]|uniref:M96 mating-specific protein family n=1 Tax=Phytophthora cactorum TaxID=29920 RepID=A0A329SND4_9STRA|nr:hypothetical protein Pcac1_g6394 [Phytophthora cactorum]KAG2829814.1 hypothetical protein PC112_g7946 [Phytophthora cactorum]KAG3176566.1 hypothetical protein C6341_g8905 [Phytophthora cactorum]KAG3223483.1 hypothetical protein PC129_g5831 [Phytophthora cactorum]RAW38220.1 hypothetical protein PC110_g5513 [Phytophthora cactorum]
MVLELEEALALLDEAPAASNELQLSQVPSPIADWTLDLHWGTLDDDNGDVGGVDASAVTRSENATEIALNRKTKRKKVNPNKARDERRFQLIELKEQVAELEFTLQRLQTIRSKRPKRDEHPSHSSGVPPVWQEICSRQLGRRLEAERENMKLKNQYEKEKQLVKTLEKMLYKRHATSNDTEPQATKQTRRTDIPAGYIERMAAMIFKDLAAGVKVCYSRLDSFFETARPVPMDLIRHNGLLDERKKLKGTERKFYDRRTMPFDMRTTGDAWWENWHNYRGQRFQDIAANEITESFGLEMSDFKTNVSGTAYAQQISQRHIEDKRIVFVWDAYVEPFGFANERVGGVYFLEQNYVLVEPEDWSSERVSGNRNGCATRVSTCYVITPYFLDPKLKEDAKAMAVIHFLVSALSTNIMALSEMVETLLLDLVLRQGSDK